MHAPRWLAWLLWLAALPACTGVSPRPEELAARPLPPPSSDAATAAAVAEATAAARQALQQRRFAEAEELAEAALRRDPGADRARVVLGSAMLGRALRERGRDGELPELALVHRADGETLTAFRRSPGDPVVGLLRGRCLADSGHLTAAAAAAEESLGRIAPSADPDYLELLEAAAAWCYELGEEERATPHLRELLHRRPGDVAAHFRLGFCLLRAAATAAGAEEAAREFARAAELLPDDGDLQLAIVAAHARAAELWAEAGDAGRAAAARDAALAACAEAAGRFPALAEPHFRAGVLAERGGDAAAARSAYEEALRREEDHLGALLNLAALHHAAGEAALARALWGRALAQGERLGESERERILDLLGPVPDGGGPGREGPR